jgi:hypothetical protein
LTIPSGVSDANRNYWNGATQSSWGAMFSKYLVLEGKRPPLARKSLASDRSILADRFGRTKTSC